MAPTPGGVYCGENKMLTSFQIEIFLGFFLTAKLHDLNHALRNHPLLTPLHTHEGLSEARHLPCEPTGVAVKKKLLNFQPISS
jgi:hypothetical protein